MSVPELRAVDNLADIDLQKFTDKNLDKLEQAVAVEKTRRQEVKLIDARAKMIEIAASVNMKPEDLYHAIGKSAKGKIKYRNPEDPGQGWTGRGRKPAWLEVALEQGHVLEEFEVNHG